MEDKYIGKIINGYKVNELCNYKSNDGHKLYNIECLRCGHTKNGVFISTLKKTVNTCNHFYKKAKWSCKKLSSTYVSMLDRCYNVKNKSYRFYGEKGITVCDEWLNNPQLFNDWSLNNGYTRELSIDRIDETKDYSPNNCRWITTYDNSKWKSTTNHITVNGITDSGRGWSRRLGLGINYINKYLRKNGIDNCIIHIKELLNK